MFIYGLAPNRCYEDGCDCYCETSSTDGKCTMKDNSDYNLYVYTGEIVNIRNYMAVRVILIYHMSYFLTILKSSLALDIAKQREYYKTAGVNRITQSKSRVRLHTKILL